MTTVHLSTLGFIQGLGWTEVVVVLFLILLLFGAKRLPELARGFGKSIKEFKKATSNIEDDIRSAIEDEPQRPPQQANSAPIQETEPPKPSDSEKRPE